LLADNKPKVPLFCFVFLMWNLDNPMNKGPTRK
jgi:hypothetical protein